jgi:hypothetical protein
MKNLRIVLVGILLAVPLFALNASSSVDAGPVDVQQTPSVTGYCWVYWNGHWYVVPC